MNKILLLSDLTLDIIQKKLNSQLASQGYVVENLFGDINILLSTINPDEYNLVIVILDPFFSKYSSEEYVLICNSFANFMNKSKSSNIIINNFLAGDNNRQLYFSKEEIQLSRLLKDIEDTKNLLILDFVSIINQISIDKFYNFALGHLFQMPFSKLAIESLSEEIIKIVLALSEPEKKVIVLDCDNTLWGGIIGEDGIDDTKCSKNADGIVYFHFQKFLKELKNSGFLLSICSKNNFTDVEDAFNKKNMPLKFDDFIVKKINWQNKATNIQEIAAELNLGLNSFIFIDDSDFEVGNVRLSLPDVTVLQFTSEYKNFMDISRLNCFKKKRVLQEDRQKMQQYLDNQQRQALQNNVNSIDEYIAQLDIVCEYKLNDLDNIVRLAQLTDKTNQFNLNKVPMTSNELINFIESGNLIISLAVSDKFGDYGVVGMALISFTDKVATVENIVISCRALGRKIEFQFWNYIKDQIKLRNSVLKNILFNKTAKNQPAEDFYNQVKEEI